MSNELEQHAAAIREYIPRLISEYQEELDVLKSEKADATSLRKVRYAIKLLREALVAPTAFRMATLHDRAVYHFDER